MTDKEILSPDKQLRRIKIESYYNLLFNLEKYRRLVIYRNVNYPKIDWINSLIFFYDVMYPETKDEELKSKYKDLFEKIEKLNYSTDIEYEELLKLSKKMMDFADDTGITKISKYDEEEPPGGAEYG